MDRARSLRDSLERNQVWVYLLTAAAGLGIGTTLPNSAAVAEALVWPALALLMYATFTQVPLAAIPKTFRDRGFLIASLIGNFLVIPLMAWGLVQWAPGSPAIRLGILMTLVAPCTDWFITFTHMGRGDTARATALAPLNMVVQLILLPVYLRAFADPAFGASVGVRHMVPAAALILVPLALAATTDFWLRRHRRRGLKANRSSRWVEAFSWFPVPALGLVILLVMTSHASAVVHSLDLLPRVGGIYVLYLAVALVLARCMSVLFKLPKEPARTLAFTYGTRNSFVVLPLALALPSGWELTAVVVIMQSMIELLGMIGYLWLVPRVLFPEHQLRL
ncbi:arsenic resistance protein [Rothia uropygialis]|uniref:arsenic resistance protein n=1 Tax=Kocuria sp. 36 TaxID=1415402 RepID=UPI00101C08E7|nr:arsenic resistance protein [Kocuria sp. 36]